MDLDALLATLGWLVVASTVVFGLVSTINHFVPRRAAALRHALWALVLIRLLLPPAIASPISLWQLFDGSFFGWGWLAPWQATGDLVGTQIAASTAFHEALHVAVTGASTFGGWSGASTLADLWLVGLWLVGVVFTGAFLLGRRWRYRRLVARARIIGDGPTRAFADAWCRRFGLSRNVRLVTSEAPVVPFTLGTLRPVVFLPEKVARAADRTLIEAVIAHELAHVKRWDDLWLTLQHAAQALFFFHPVVWLTARSMSDEREIACDRLVLTSGSLSAKRYGQSLLRILGLQLKPAAAAAAAGNHRKWTMRIQQIANTRAASPPRTLPSLLAVAVLGSILLPVAGTGDQGEGSSLPAPEMVMADAATAVRAMLTPVFVAQTYRATLDDLMPGAKVTSAFGMRRHPIDGDMVHHDGIDLSTGEDSPVFVPRGGVVEVAEENFGPDGKYGTVVIVDHGSGLKTFYAHLASRSVVVGDGITGGDQIGRAGNTGISSGPHLHFEIWKDGEKVDPERIVEILLGC